MFENILVPLDGSRLAERALPHAEQLARVFGSCIMLLHVMDPSVPQGFQGAIEPLNWQIHKAGMELYMQQAAGRLVERGVKAQVAILEGKTAENIVDYAYSQEVDLIVMSTHGHSGLSRWNTSSITQKVVHKAYLPLLIVRAYEPEPVEEVGACSFYRRILLPFDSSRRAESTLPLATTLAQGCGARLLLEAVIKPPDVPVPAPYPEEITALITRFMDISREAVRSYLADLQSRLPEETQVIIEESDSVAQAIHDVAVREDADLVIFSAHGQTGRLTWPFGTIVENYIAHGEKSVLVIQDAPRAQIRPTAAEMAAEKFGRR